MKYLTTIMLAVMLTACGRSTSNDLYTITCSVAGTNTMQFTDIVSYKFDGELLSFRAKGQSRDEYTRYKMNQGEVCEVAQGAVQQ